MSQACRNLGAMKRPSTARRSRPTVAADPVQLTWAHYGRLHRVTAWPEVQFAADHDGRWEAYEPDPSSEAFIAGAIMLDAGKWQRYLEFLPAAGRAFVNAFKHGRLAALVVLARCPALADELAAVPALLALGIWVRAADLPRRLLEPLRSALWNPAAPLRFERTPALSERALAAGCHALAA